LKIRNIAVRTAASRKAFDPWVEEGKLFRLPLAEFERLNPETQEEGVFQYTEEDERGRIDPSKTIIYYSKPFGGQAYKPKARARSPPAEVAAKPSQSPEELKRRFDELQKTQKKPAAAPAKPAEPSLVEKRKAFAAETARLRREKDEAADRRLLELAEAAERRRQEEAEAAERRQQEEEEAAREAEWQNFLKTIKPIISRYELQAEPIPDYEVEFVPYQISAKPGMAPQPGQPSSPRWVPHTHVERHTDPQLRGNPIWFGENKKIL